MPKPSAILPSASKGCWPSYGKYAIWSAARDGRWLGSSKEDLSAFPREVRKVFGRALFDVRNGDTPEIAKALPQFGSGVFELRDAFDGNAYRSIYVVKLARAIYVLHAFMKKSKSGRGIPREDIGTSNCA